jgi:hypothetical protein
MIRLLLSVFHPYRSKLSLFVAVLFAPFAQAQGFLHLPVKGFYGKDFIIVNYVDWGATAQILDHHCGSKTYDGHAGTDFVLRNFRQMDSGVMVCAAAKGVVTYVQDGLFDREKVSAIAKGFGNYIAIRHFNGYYSYYAHLAKNSIRVQVGDTVEPNENIARVGSSGNSSDPHLHFELWWDSVEVVDPFTGPCGNRQSLWMNEPAYDTTFGVWISGLTSFIPDLDTLREEPPGRQIFHAGDSAVAYWALLKGLKAGDSLTLRWLQPDNGLWFTFHYRVPNDAWYFYFWSYIDVPLMYQAGNWKAQLLRNGKAANEVLFQQAAPSNLVQTETRSVLTVEPNPVNGLGCICTHAAGVKPDYLEIRDIQGQEITKLYPRNSADPGQVQCFTLDARNFHPGIYYAGFNIGGKLYWNKISVQ